MCDRHGAAAKRRREGMDSVLVRKDAVGNSGFELAEVDEDRTHFVVRHAAEREIHARLEAADAFRRIARPFIAAIGQHAGAARYNDRAAESVARSAIDRSHAKGG